MEAHHKERLVIRWFKVRNVIRIGIVMLAALVAIVVLPQLQNRITAVNTGPNPLIVKLIAVGTPDERSTFLLEELPLDPTVSLTNQTVQPGRSFTVSFRSRKGQHGFVQLSDGTERVFPINRSWGTHYQFESDGQSDREDVDTSWLRKQYDEFATHVSMPASWRE